MRLKYTAKARSQLKRLPSHVRDQVLSIIEDIKSEPLFAGDRLKGSRNLYRAKVPDYRIIYMWSVAGSVIRIILIERRSSHTYHRVNPLPSPHILN